MRPALPTLTAALLATLLGGCDLLGIEGAAAGSARKEAEGKAVGGACRHAGRALEDCYTLNKKADKAAVFAGWREMNDYMRENKIEVVAPEIKPQAPAPASAPASAPADDDAHESPPKKHASKGSGNAH
jgi:hypothetical protein